MLCLLFFLLEGRVGFFWIYGLGAHLGVLELTVLGVGCVCVYACMHACMHACMYVSFVSTCVTQCLLPVCPRTYICMLSTCILQCVLVYVYIYISLSLSVSVCVCPTCSWIWMLCGCDEDVSSIYLTLTACQGRHRALKAETG